MAFAGGLPGGLGDAVRWPRGRRRPQPSGIDRYALGSESFSRILHQVDRTDGESLSKVFDIAKISRRTPPNVNVTH